MWGITNHPLCFVFFPDLQAFCSPSIWFPRKNLQCIANWRTTAFYPKVLLGFHFSPGEPSHIFPQLSPICSLLFCSTSSLKIEWMGEAGKHACPWRAGCKYRSDPKWGSRDSSCVWVCVCVYLSLLGCGNREDNRSSSTASNNDQIGAQASLPEPTWLGFMILVSCECVNLWSSCSANHSPDNQLFHMDKGPCLRFRGHNWKSWKFAFEATFLTRGCQLPFYYQITSPFIWIQSSRFSLKSRLHVLPPSVSNVLFSICFSSKFECHFPHLLISEASLLSNEMPLVGCPPLLCITIVHVSPF